METTGVVTGRHGATLAKYFPPPLLTATKAASSQKVPAAVRWHSPHRSPQFTSPQPSRHLQLTAALLLREFDWRAFGPLPRSLPPPQRADIELDRVEGFDAHQ